jgi:Outer membrane protein
MKQLTRIFFICFFIYQGNSYAQESYNLHKLLTYAVLNNAEIKKAALRQSESQFKTKEVIANGLPQLNGNINYSRMGIPEISISQDIISSLPEEVLPLLGKLKEIDALHIISAGVTVSQLIYSQPYLTGIKQTRKSEELYSAMSVETETEVIYSIAATYYQIQNNYSTLKILDESIENLEALNKILRLQYENDFIKQTDVKRVKVKVSNLKTQKETLENAINIQIQILKIICGIPSETEITVETGDLESNKIQGPDVGQFTPDALPLFQLLQKQNELAALQVASDQAAYFPNLVAFGQFNYSSYNTSFNLRNLSNVNTIGFKATIPIFSSGMRKYKVLQSKSKLLQVSEDFKVRKRQLSTSYENAVNTLMSSWKSLQEQQENKDLAKEVYDQVKLQFDEEMASLTDLLNDESSLLEAENLYNQQLLKYQIAELDMYKSTGKLKEIINSK